LKDTQSTDPDLQDLSPKRESLCMTIREFYDFHNVGDAYYGAKKKKYNISMAKAENKSFVVPSIPRSIPTQLKRKASSARTFSKETNTMPSESWSPFEVYKTCIIFGTEENDGKKIIDITEETSDKKTLIYYYGDIELGRGRTKVVHKLRWDLDGPYSTAKEYYQGEVEGQPVTARENFIWLREELIRTSFSAKVTEDFVKKTKEMDISIHDVVFLVPVLVHEKEKPGDDGTYRAGRHPEDDFAGQTCDALAHWSLSSSENRRLLVDIQGVVVTNTNRPPRVYLFDVQIHSVTRESGLGDGGHEGIVRFIEQHVCNKICQRLGLPDLSTIGDATVDDDPVDDDPVDDDHVDDDTVDDNINDESDDELAA
ncbi:3471_t:CDS:2, partial [Acaulospora colombiana]